MVVALLCSGLAGAGANAGAWAAEGTQLTIVVENVRSAAGAVHLALWDGPKGFTKPDFAIRTDNRPAKSDKVSFVFQDLKPGRYAVATFFDENGNGKFDRTWLGLPDEGLGFSNDARIKLGPPSFDEAAFNLGAESRIVVVPLRYWSDPKVEPKQPREAMFR